MTMHLQRGLTTLNTKKRKASKRKPDSHYMDGWRKQNKFYKQKISSEDVCEVKNHNIFFYTLEELQVIKKNV